MNFGTVAILGPGLIGGSLALALAERGLAKKLVVYARSERGLDAVRNASVEAELIGNPSEAVREADIVVLCVPIETMGPLVQEFVVSLKPTALVTDVGSVKGTVDRELAPLLDGRAQWIGSHPMAGSEQGGFSAARADLFVGASVVITPTESTAPEAARRAHEFWSALGGNVFSFPPAVHDLLVAEISHIPHLSAAALVNHSTVESRELAGGGFRDATRIASGSPELWTEILMANRECVTASLGSLLVRMTAFHDALAAGDKKSILRFLEKARDARATITDKKPSLSNRS